MTFRVQYFTVQKDGSPPEHNDDNAASDGARGRFAISDGAAESGFSRMWSKLLVDQFVQSQAAADAWSAWLPQAQQQWLADLKGVEIPWYGEQQFQQGSFATFLGLVVHQRGESRRPWHAAAVGDSCLFHTRAGVLQECFPLEHSSQFTMTPRLIGSRSSIDEIVEKRAMTFRGIAEVGDRLWLASDALSKWCLTQEEEGQAPWEDLSQLLACDPPPDRIATWVADLRTNGGMVNDDVTLMAIEL
jgi:hypothetical protein